MPTPTLWRGAQFTVSAFESPYPVGQGITGFNLTARSGNLYLSPKANSKRTVSDPCGSTGTNFTEAQKAVMFVASGGTGYLVSS